MRPTKRLRALVSKLSTVRMIDELSLQLSAYARSRPNMGQGQLAGRVRRYRSSPLPPPWCSWRSAVLRCRRPLMVSQKAGHLRLKRLALHLVRRYVAILIRTSARTARSDAEL